MADGKNIPIKIVTSADTKGADDAQKKIAGLHKEVATAAESEAKSQAESKQAQERQAVSIESLRKQVRALNDEVEKAEIGSKEYDTAVKKLTESQRDLGAAEKTHYENLSKARQAHGATEKSTRNVAQSTLLFSQGLEDAQYGIRGVLNNIPALVMSLGGGAGLAGVISMAAVGISLLTEHFDLFGEKTKEVSEAEKQALLDHRQYAKEAAEAAAQRAEELGRKEVEETLQNQNDLLEIGLNFMRDQTVEARARRDAEERIMKAQDELELARIDDAVSAGSLTEQQANSRRAGVRYGAQERARKEELKQAQERAAVALREQEASIASFTEKDSVSRQAQDELAMRRAEMEKAKHGVKGAIAGDRYRKAQEEYQQVRDSEFSTAGEEQRARNKSESAEALAAEYGPAANLTFEKAKAVAEKAEEAFLEADARAKEAATAVAAQQKVVATATRNARAAQRTEQITTETVQSESAIATEIQAKVQQTAAREAEKKKREEDLRLQKELEKATLGQKEMGLDSLAGANRAQILATPQAQTGPRAKELQQIAREVGNADTTAEIREIAQKFIGTTGATAEMLRLMLAAQEKQAVEIENLKARLKKL